MQKEKRKNNSPLYFLLSSFLILLSSFFFFLSSCSFDYGEVGSSGEEVPDLVMRNVEYIRVVSSDPIVRFHAEYAERYEQQELMKLEAFSFEQFSNSGRDINAIGRAGRASVNSNSGNVIMEDGVSIEIESEDIIIVTEQLEWKDEDRLLLTGDETEVNVLRQNGTSFFGIGLRADARRRTWEFMGPVSGTYIHEDDDNDNEEEDEGSE